MYPLLNSISGLRPQAVVAVIAALVLSACAPKPEATRHVSPEVVAMYSETLDSGFVIAAVNPGYATDHNRRQQVYYNGGEAPGSVVVDPYARLLYYVMDGGQAIRYGIAVGREGKGFRGNAVIRRKEEWPAWTPTQNMIRSEPEVYAQFAGGLPGGPDNPLGARALYLYRGGKDTYYRIHGTNATQTIGRATSAGCIRLFNQDILDLYERVPLGTQVIVRSPEESFALEGALVELENGYLVPAGSPEAAEYLARQEDAATDSSEVFTQISG